ncbi:uncharacterized protein B0P05DRAFT_24397 [Gilbertella persicaria]|uniref:uncharacterized protein n=1 Tax=Gilbertella persicaria TaxID=101096 RepID=UPI00221F30A5|nr:uncharacterized protein B0P05DRAFT_24397 [Gilbertella persicaria]KAI8085830.1 hypothetical protein B0P05DRAFT_24397 [Gilbertella persicaria]
MSHLSNTKAIHLETTPRAYYEYYMTAAPSYDLYPGLSRRLVNGHVHRPTRPKRQPKRQAHFLNINNTMHLRRNYNEQEDPLWQPQQQQQGDMTPPWDLYPAILRRVCVYVL